MTPLAGAGDLPLTTLVQWVLKIDGWLALEVDPWGLGGVGVEEPFPAGWRLARVLRRKAQRVRVFAGKGTPEPVGRALTLEPPKLDLGDRPMWHHWDQAKSEDSMHRLLDDGP